MYAVWVHGLLGLRSRGSSGLWVLGGFRLLGVELRALGFEGVGFLIEGVGFWAFGFRV